MKSLFKSNQGFTLAELLIALAILGVIATFTIPKILNSSQNGQNTAIAKEAASMIAGAYSSYTLNNGASAGVNAGVLTQYMNYVAVQVAAAPAVSAATTGQALQDCSATLVCIKLHNGGILQYDTAQTFGGSTTTHAVAFNLDPDGLGPQGRITFWQYYNGRLTTGQQALTPTSAGGSITTTTTDPAYLANWN